MIVYAEALFPRNFRMHQQVRHVYDRASFPRNDKHLVAERFLLGSNGSYIDVLLRCAIEYPLDTGLEIYMNPNVSGLK